MDDPIHVGNSLSLSLGSVGSVWLQRNRPTGTHKELSVVVYQW